MSPPEQGDVSRAKLYIVLISVHGLIRGRDLELGRDADTGGQVLYVVELARALARHADVWRVDLLTRRVEDAKVSSDYAEPTEALADNAYIVRLPAGPRRYLRKEVLWPHLNSFIDQAVQHVRRVGRVPEVIHSHYADAGYVGARLAGLLGVPLVHTGHSLGREKRRRLIDQGVKESTIESQYNMAQRVEAEEVALDAAELVIASTRQEIEQQYSLYDNYHPHQMKVIPPGVDLSKFHPPGPREPDPPIKRETDRFLRDPKKQIILAISRADPRKNLDTLVRTFGQSEELRQRANLVIIAGNRDDIAAMERAPKEVMTSLLLAIDRFDLYGDVAYPKHHQSEDVPDLYRLAARSRGVFINPALTEPFGLTLIEAAASGLPVVATEDGGPRDILEHCQNGLLIDPLDSHEIAKALLETLTDRHQWQRWSRAGLKGAHAHYTWDSHVQTYLKSVHKILGKRHTAQMFSPPKSRLPTVDRILLCGVDDTLLGDAEALERLKRRLAENGHGHAGFAVATGRSQAKTLEALRDWDVPTPDLMITSLGAEIYYGPQQTEDREWVRHTDYRWEPELLRAAMAQVKGARPQPRGEQGLHKISYFYDPSKAPKKRELKRYLRKRGLHANVIYSHQMFLDLVPIRVSKGLALRYIAMKWGLPLGRFLVAGDSGNDDDMLLGDTLGVVVSNHSPELDILRGEPRIYFAEGDHAWGIIEGLDYYDFLDEIRVPNDSDKQQ
ncbi:MAG: HAD-IIB family hydrolase [Gammaproteobacteria bacterium]|nr:HAD-IIB family hydrolase [Gammaproteobacteria bacterium]NIR85891.1 HAD-IIB family hydrolase [Gammaproteobacteria bacterium]NIR92082.1 HAD-IIB family hydrolase [Gammaproteobacteria bacterium]NIV51418.1 HAD-IIB family hydrolase [Gammaproteobacteria bacterium]NIV77103.1 HAD-IIB family hydrolase [Gammaproteobacteria bacterium]